MSLSYFYHSTINDFLRYDENKISGIINDNTLFENRITQRKSWKSQIRILKEQLFNFSEGSILFEFSIPRLGKRVDTIILYKNIVYLLEFKVGEKKYNRQNIDQVWDYALDLKNFYSPCHQAIIVPILVATESKYSQLEFIYEADHDLITKPISCAPKDINELINLSSRFYSPQQDISSEKFLNGSYQPTPTIIEAALSLYRDHKVENITRSDAGAANLLITAERVSEIISEAKINEKKVICFVTGVPGAGKTLVGLKVATLHMDDEHEDRSVYLSGNGPLVQILIEALARDRIEQAKMEGEKLRKKEAIQAVKAFIQNIHHYRDAYIDNDEAPYDHVAIFDEAQRAWNKEQTVKFMKQRKNQPDFNMSEPEFLISCLDRHDDWAVIVCLVGGGQEINTGEAGISEWLHAIHNSFSKWNICISDELIDKEYGAQNTIKELDKQGLIEYDSSLHLAVSMRSFRAENLSLFVKQLLDIEIDEAKQTHNQLKDKYPIYITRDLEIAKKWIKSVARGNQRYGMVMSSQASRLKPLAYDIRAKINPVHWFLNEKDDVRSSYFLEDAATEFQYKV